MKPLEIPYNFDKKLIDILYVLDNTGNSYDAIYCCPYKDDYIAAKRYHTAENGLDMTKSNDMTRDEYIAHIQYINKTFPNKIMLLLQQNHIIMDREKLNFYLALGFTKFCVGNIEQAKELKTINSSYYVIGSLTMKMSLSQFSQDIYSQWFDGFVLFFPFNRNFNAIKQLPSHFNYILLVNCDCNIHCKGTHHWFATREQELLKTLECPNSFYLNHAPDWDQLIRIRPMDMPLFDPYISAYKLQGREQTTASIIQDVCLWTTDYSRYPGITYTTDIYQTLSKTNN